MALQSDIQINVSKFRESSILPKTSAFNERLMDNTAKAPTWPDVGAAKYREMIYAGETSIPKPVLLDTAEPYHIPSRDPNRLIPCRVLRPAPGNAIKGVYMHIHLGGFVLCDEQSQDPALAKIATNSSLLVISIGYRLAPEHPFPAPQDDCLDAAEWLIANAESTFGAPLSFIGGESAGAHLSVLTAVALAQSSAKYPHFALKGLLLHFGCYDLSILPQAYTFRPPRTLLIDRDTLLHSAEAALPGRSTAELKDPAVSPLYADLAALPHLPPALFTVGTMDPLLDDTMFMALKWLMAGGEAVVRVYAGASHAYLNFPEELYPAAKEVFADMKTFVDAKLA